MKAEGVIDCEVILQTGVGVSARWGGDPRTLPFEQIQSILKRASIVVCHGGTGSLITALREVPCDSRASSLVSGRALR